MTTFVEFRLLDPDLQTVHGILPFQKGDLYLQLNEPGSGSVKTALDIASAALVESGGFVEAHYRAGVRGGFFVENLGESDVNSGEEAGRGLEVSGRGALALLEDAVVWTDGTGSNKRTFSGTQAAMLISLIEAAQTRGGLGIVDWDFTATLDSDGVAWTDDFPLELTVGTSLLDVVRQIAKTGIDFEMNPDGSGNYVLSAYKNGIGSNKSGTVYFRVGVNCTEVSHSEAGGGIRNALLVKYKGGYTSVSDSASITARRRRESALNYDFVQRPDSAGTFANAELQGKKNPKKQISVKVYDGAGPRAFVDYVLGDTVTLDVRGAEEEYRVRGIHLSWVDNENAEVIVDLNSMILENEIRVTQDLDWLLNEWKTAHDAGLLEVAFWAAIGDKNITYNVNKLLIANGFLYVANYNDYSLLAYDLDGGGWTRVILPQRPVCLANVGSDIYIGAGDGIYKYSGGTVTQVGDANWASDPGITSVLTMTAIGNYVFCSGVLDSVDAVPVTGVAKYDTVGDTWSDIGGGSATEAMITDGSSIFAAFGTAVKEWNGSSWTQLGSSFSLAVASLAVYGTELLAGNAQTGGIFIWDGATWSTFGGGVNGAVYAIGVYLTDVYIGGTFTDVGSKVARYSGGSWWELEEGCNSTVTDIVMDGEDLYVGGSFTAAGDKNAQGIAAYFNNFDSLADYLEDAAGTFNLGEAIHNAIAKTSMTGADEMPLWDSITQRLRKITWTNIIASIKTWADTIYVALTGNQTVAGVKTFSSFPVTPSSAPTTDYQVANKKYVDDNVGGGGTPGGSDGDVQVNESGSFGGNANFHYDAATHSLEIGGHVLDLTLLEGMISSITEGDSNGRMQFTFSDDITDGSFITFVRAKGTKASPTAVTDGTVIGYVRGRAWQQSGESFGNATDTQISIELVADGDWDVDDNPTRLEIYTTPAGSGDKVLRTTIGSDGNINITTGKEYRVNGVQHLHTTADITNAREVLTASRTYYVGYDLGTVTMTIASPCVVTKSSHGLENDDPVVFRTTGALPTGVTAGTVYYVKNKTTNTFEISTSPGGSSVNTSGSQSGTHSAHTGNDNNNGLTTGRAGAFLTIQKAVNVTSALDISVYDVTIQLSSGLFVEAVTLKKIVGSGLVTILGNNTTPSNVVVTQSVTNGSTFLNETVGWKITGVKVTATGTSGRCISSIGAGASVLIGIVDFGQASVHKFMTNGGYIEATDNYTISAGADYHEDIIDGISHQGPAAGGTITITLTGTPAFASAFAFSTRLGYLRCNATVFSGSATGVRYIVSANGIIFTGGGGANFLPGNAAGSTATGGQYI